MINVDSEFKNRTKKIKQQSIKLGILDGELTVKEVHFMPVKQFNALPVWMLRARKKVIAKGLKYSFEGNLFKTIMKQIEITVKNAAELKDKNVNFQYGIYIDNDFKYINLGNYYIKDIEDNKGKSELVVTGYDKMINFMKIFKQSDLQLTYPCTMLALIQKVCEVCGVELYSTNFFNSDLVVNEDYFTAQELTYRDVLEKVAETTETTIFIKDNKLCLHKLANNPVEKLDASYLTSLTVKEKFGPVNALVLGRGDVEDNVEARDDTSIAQNGRCEIRFDENEFVEYQREQVIDEMFEQIKGLEYYSFEGSDVGVMWLEPCDLIEVEDSEENTYKTIYLSANITINTGISSDIEAGIPEETNTEYKVTTKEEKKTLKVERLAKKNEGLIQDVIEQQTETTTKLTKVEQDIDSITQTVSSVETKVDQVENKADNAQTSANNAQSTADGAVSQITTTNQKVTQIEQTVEGISQSVSDVEETIETVEQKADNAQSTADNINENLTTNYYNKTETNSQINQKANEITSTVSQTYSTKTETTNAKNEAIESANSSTDEKLQDYSTTEEMNSAITQSATSITSEVNQSINNIQIGGTNLIPNSAPYNLEGYGINNRNNIELTLEDEETAPFGKCLRIRTLKQLDSTSQWGIYITPTCKVLDTNKEYCFNIWLKATANTNVTVGYSRGGQTTFAVTTSWQKFTYKFTPLVPTGESHAFWISLPSGTILGRQVFIHSIKLEEGNKNTAWSPSPDDDVKNVEFGTKIEQNAKNVQVAWNNESQNIRIENDNGNSTMGFYDNNTKFAEMGVNNVDNDRYISFAVPCNYNQSIADGMAWGIQTPDGAFHPILFIKNFHMGAQQSDDVYGELALRFCDLVLEGIESGIKSGNIKMYGNALNGLVFESDDGSQLLSINPPNSNIPEWENGGLNILGNIEFYKNAAGTCSLKMSNNNDSNYFLATNDGAIHCSILYISSGSNQIVIWSDGTVSGEITFYSVPYYQNHPLVYGGPGHIYQIQWTGSQLQFLVDNKNVTDNISDKRLKSDIKDVDEDLIKAINELEYKQFKRDNKGGLIGVGIIAQDLVEKLEKYGKKTDDYEILQQFQYKTDDDTLYYEVEDKQFLLLRLMAKEQEIKELQEKVNNQDEIIQNLLARVEKLEKEVKINE